MTKKIKFVKIKKKKKSEDKGYSESDTVRRRLQMTTR